MSGTKKPGDTNHTTIMLLMVFALALATGVDLKLSMAGGCAGVAS